MKQPPSKRQLDLLGVALRAGETPDSAGLTGLYAGLMSFAAYALQDVQTRVIDAVGVPARVTARVKTLDTMREKLVRLEHLRLANMDDLIGVRIVGDLTLVEQDAMAARIVQAFPGSRIKDRRAAPMAGYRAVHVILDLGVIHAEIQIRTELQAAWADVFEATADRWGRGIRYGELVEPDPSGRADARADLIAILHTLSLDAIAGHDRWARTDGAEAPVAGGGRALAAKLGCAHRRLADSACPDGTGGPAVGAHRGGRYHY